MLRPHRLACCLRLKSRIRHPGRSFRAECGSFSSAGYRRKKRDLVVLARFRVEADVLLIEGRAQACGISEGLRVTAAACAQDSDKISNGRDIGRQGEVFFAPADFLPYP